MIPEELEETQPTSTDVEFNEYWGSLTDPQRLEVLEAQINYWSLGEPVPTDVYMALTTNHIDVEYLQEHLMEDK